MKVRHALAVALLAVLACSCGDSSGSGSTSGTAPVKLDGTVNDKGTKTLTAAGTVAVHARNFSFEPTFIVAPAGSTLVLKVDAQGEPHTFTSDAAGVDKTLSSGATEISVTVPASGVLNFYCRFHRSSGMQGAVLNPSSVGTAATSTGSPSGGPTTTGSGYSGYGGY